MCQFVTLHPSKYSPLPSYFILLPLTTIISFRAAPVKPNFRFSYSRVSVARSNGTSNQRNSFVRCVFAKSSVRNVRRVATPAIAYYTKLLADLSDECIQRKIPRIFILGAASFARCTAAIARLIQLPTIDRTR